MMPPRGKKMTNARPMRTPCATITYPLTSIRHKERHWGRYLLVIRKTGGSRRVITRDPGDKRRGSTRRTTATRLRRIISTPRSTASRRRRLHLRSSHVNGKGPLVRMLLEIRVRVAGFGGRIRAQCPDDARIGGRDIEGPGILPGRGIGDGELSREPRGTDVGSKNRDRGTRIDGGLRLRAPNVSLPPNNHQQKPNNGRGVGWGY
jgi:hypothetical protein